MGVGPPQTFSNRCIVPASTPVVAGMAMGLTNPVGLDAEAGIASLHLGGDSAIGSSASVMQRCDLAN
jgi:hypothetical protein